MGVCPLGRAFSPLQMAHESTVEHGRLNAGEVGMAPGPWLSQRGHPGQQVGDRGQQNQVATGMGVPAMAP